ncbi:hypothetical protein H7B90_06060 [Cohnella xylanilytica]|uniref:Copper amine oxidase-like protein n=2 Tax=Cohnella xylanilytica TaxID=557555 RepID=A0A841TRN9_9BACL|nr:hypothetical protein [Cohnella xylanilytica]MBB6690966.1 hypothetical protein [Cohnella xylanilytica]
MKKKIIMGCLVLTLSTMATSVSADALKYKNLPARDLVWDGQQAKVTDVPVVIMDGRTLIPVYLLRAFGYSVSSDGNKVVVTSEDSKYEVAIGIVHSFENFLEEVTVYDQLLLTTSMEMEEEEETPEEKMKFVSSEWEAILRNYDEKVKLLNQLHVNFETNRSVFKESDKMIDAFRQTTAAWFTYAKERTKESKRIFLKEIQEAHSCTRQTQQAVDEIFNKSMVRMDH